MKRMEKGTDISAIEEAIQQKRKSPIELFNIFKKDLLSVSIFSFIALIIGTLIIVAVISSDDLVFLILACLSFIAIIIESVVMILNRCKAMKYIKKKYLDIDKEKV